MDRDFEVESERLADEELRALHSLLTGPPHRGGEGDVVFTLQDDTEFVIRGVRVDSVGPSADARGVIGVEFFDVDTVIHVPFVKYWTFQY